MSQSLLTHATLIFKRINFVIFQLWFIIMMIITEKSLFFFFFSIASAGGCHQITFSNAENTWANKPGIIYLYFRFTYLEAY